MEKTYAVILAGGTGSRSGKDIPKQFLSIGNRPMIAWSLEKFNKLSEIDAIIIVMHNEYHSMIRDICGKLEISKLTEIISGGETRQKSSYNAVNCLNFNDEDILVLHDAARPFVSVDIIKNCIKEAKRHGSAGTYIKATDTVAEGSGDFIKNVPQRENIYYTQTPQCFRFRIIKEAHERAASLGTADATDDVQLVIDAGHRVQIVEGEKSNIKITSPIDLELAELIAGKISE